MKTKKPTNKPWTLNKDNTVVIDKSYHWHAMASCPLGVKVQLLNPGGVAVYGIYNGHDTTWLGWAPVPTHQIGDTK